MQGLTVRSRHHKTQLGWDHYTGHRLLMTCQGGSRCRYFPFTHNSLRTCIPVPQQDSTVSRTRCNVAVWRYVALRAWQASHHTIVTKYYLYNFSCNKELCLYVCVQTGTHSHLELIDVNMKCGKTIFTIMTTQTFKKALRLLFLGYFLRY